MLIVRFQIGLKTKPGIIFQVLIKQLRIVYMQNTG